jgi:hypothetical protein
VRSLGAHWIHHLLDIAKQAAQIGGAVFEEDDCAELANDENDLGRENHKDVADVALILHSSFDCLIRVVDKSV